jgi:hypothetical protein
MPTREDALALFPEGYNPTEVEIEKKLEALIISYNNRTNNSYEYSEAIMGRKSEYPSLEVQLDKLFHDIDNGTLDETGEFFTALKEVKDNNPKPSE